MWVVVGLLLIAIAWAVTSVTLFAVDPDLDAERTTIQSLLSVAFGSAAITVVLGLFLGHLAMARLRWPGHFGRLPRLIGDVWSASDQPARPAGIGVLAGILVALFVPPAISAGLAATGIGLTVTAVGLALVTGWQAAAAEWRRISLGRSTATVADRRVSLVTFGGAAAVTGIVRFLVLDGTCLLDRLVGGPCGGPTVAVASAAVIGAVAVLPPFLGLGALVSLTLDGHDLADLASLPEPSDPHGETVSPPTTRHAATTSHEPAHAPEPVDADATTDAVADARTDRSARSRPVQTAPDEDELALAAAAALAAVAEEDRAETDIAPEALDDLEDVDTDETVDPTDELTPIPAPEEGTTDETKHDGATEDDAAATGASAATTAAHLEAVEPHLDRLSSDSREKVQPLLDDLAALPPDRARDIIDQIAHHHGTVSSLRTQYQRAPGIAKGAIERACVSGLKVAGIPGDDARLLSSALLQLPDDDWHALTSVLSELESSLPDGGDGGAGDERPATRPS